jgi:putative transposase
MITYTFKIKTTPNLIQKFETHLNTTRMLYNLAKETKEYAFSKGVKFSKFDLIKQLPELKNDFSWMKEVHSQTLQGVIERLDKSYDKFFKDFKEGKISKLKQEYTTKCLKNGLEINQKKLFEIGKPKWAKKKEWKSVEFKSSAIQLKNNCLSVSKIGKIKIFKSREINGNIKLARVVKKADGYYLQIVTDFEVQKCDNQAQVGIDLGISYFLVTSDSQFFENIKTTDKYSKQLKIEQRNLSRKKKFSKNFYKQVEKVKKIHLKIQRVREDCLHKVSRELANNYQTVFVEDLEVSKMVQDKKYSKAISDASWSKFVNYLEYKTELVKVDAKYSSQECNKCGHISKENRKTQEIFKCVKCSHEGNADFEASITILKRGQSLIRANVGQ